MARALSHVDRSGRVKMVDVGDKPVTDREAIARGAISMSRAALSAIRAGSVAKGDPLQAARLAGIMAAKQKPVERPSLADLGLTAEAVQATQTVSGVEPAPERQAGEVVEDGEEAVQKVVPLLKEAKVI